MLVDSSQDHRDDLQALVDAQTKKIRADSMRNALLRKVSESANLSYDVTAVIELSLNEICCYGGFSIGHCWLFDNSKKLLAAQNLWSVGSSLRCPEFVKHSSNLVFCGDDDFPENILHIKVIAWLPDIAVHNNFSRKISALQDGLKCGVAAPIVIGSEVVGVMEFYSAIDTAESKDITQVLQNVGVQIGRAIERKNYEESLLTARRTAEKSSYVLTEFLSNVSHELRTPMHAILNYASMGMHDVEHGATGKLSKYLGNIQISGRRLLSLLNNLLDLAKIGSGKMTLTLETNDLRDSVAQALIELDSLLLERGIKVVFDAGGADMHALFDKERIIQVLVNLLSNAIKFSPPGSVIDLSLHPMVAATGEAMLCCRVVDQGCGIASDELEVVFDKFIQGSKTSSGAGGTGLGLAICREIIMAHGGKIWAENNSEQGAIVNFMLPTSF